MEQRYSNQNQTAPVISAMKNKSLPVPHSYFDLTRNITFDAGLGWLIPFDCIETLPDSDYEISYDILCLTRNPLVRRLLNSCTIYVHTHGIDAKDLWEGFPTFVSRGRSGKITRTVPYSSTDLTDGYYTHEYSPSTYLGVPPVVKNDKHIDNDAILLPRKDLQAEATGLYFNALPLVFYQQICIYNYMNSNLLQDNKNFYPDDEKHLILPPDVQGEVEFLSYDSTEAIKDFSDFSDSEIADFAHLASEDTPVALNVLRCRQFQGDRFNTALPFPELLRGDIPTIDLATGTTTIPNLELLYKNGNTDTVVTSDLKLSTKIDMVDGTVHSYAEPSVDVDESGNITLSTEDSPVFSKVDGSLIYDKLPYKTKEKTVPLQIQSSVTLSQLNALQVLTLMRQRAALSDGSYNELIKAQYNKSPELHVGKPYYIGGTKQPLIFNEVVQTSESSASSPLGRTGSRAISAGNGYIGRYHSKDFGYIMSILSIVPDVYYNQGLEKMWTRLNQSDYHFPLMDNLSPQPILNKELFYSGNSVVDDDVFAYQERDSEYKSRRNVVAGGFLNSSNLDLQAYIMKRHFDSVPTLSNGFVTMFPSNMDYSVFSNSIDTPFILSITSKVKATLPLPYVTMPNDGLTRI